MEAGARKMNGVAMGRTSPKQPFRSVMQGSPKGENDVMRDGNGGWGAQNERGRHGQNVPEQPLRSVMQRSPKGGNDVMRDGNGGWGAQNERGRHGQNVPEQPLRSVMQRSPKGGNLVFCVRRLFRGVPTPRSIEWNRRRAVALRRQLCYTVNSVEFSRREV